jgi:hypothetical protein
MLVQKNRWAILWRSARWSLAIAIAFVLGGNSALAATAQEIDRDVTAALQTLYANTPGARDLGDQAKGVLVFPNIVKGGFLFAAQFGDGALRQGVTPWATIDRWRPPTGFRPASRPLATSCFLWTTTRFNILTRATGGNSGPGRPLWCWIRASGRIFQRRPYKEVSTLSSSTREG